MVMTIVLATSPRNNNVRNRTRQCGSQSQDVRATVRLGAALSDGSGASGGDGGVEGR